MAADFATRILDMALAPGVRQEAQLTISLRPHELELEIRAHGRGEREVGSFAAWLDGQLKGRGMSQEGAARAVGVSVKTVSRWVHGETEPRLRDLRRIHRAFGELPPLPGRAMEDGG